MIPSKDDPLRSPDWRWKRAQWLRSTNKYARKGREDDATILIKRYQAAKAACANDLALENLMRKMPGLFHAEQLHEREDLDLHWELEARLLAREPFDSIAHKLGVNVEVVFWYERAFYNVIEKIDNRSYIGTVAMGRSVHKGLFERDYDLLWKMLGYACGPMMVDSLTAKLANPPKVDAPDQIDAAKHAITGSAILDKAMTAAFTMPVSYNQASILDLYKGMLELQKNSGSGGDVSAMIINNINAALTALPFSTDRPSVAAGQLKYYDDQSAELRADEVLAVGLGFDSSAIREAVKVDFPIAKDGDNEADQQRN